MMSLVGSSSLAHAAGDDYPYKNATPCGTGTWCINGRWYSDWGFAYRNCTDFVTWRMRDTNGVDFYNTMRGGRWGNANTWDDNARRLGYTVDNTPAPGAIAQTDAGTYGHVAWVRSVNGDGTVNIEEYNYGTNGLYRARTVSASSFKYIHVKDMPHSISNGDFVSYRGHVYRIAGGAPIYVGTWDIFGGGQPTRALNDAEFDSLRRHPADGTFIVGARSGRVYRVAGGAPLYVSNWDHVGGAQPTISVDDSAIANAGGADMWSHLLKYPLNGTFIAGGITGRVYRVAGGAPIYVSNWDNIGGSQPVVSVDDTAIENSGGSDPWVNLRATPSDIFLRGYKTGRVFRVYDGHPYYIPSWSPYGGPQPYLDVDDTALDNCDHMNCSPFGKVDRVLPSAGQVTIEGWAMDPNSTDPVEVQVQADGNNLAKARASVSRSDVDAAFHRGVGFGYLIAAPLSPGSHRVCITAINVGKGANTQLGCSDIVVALPETLTAATPTVGGSPRVGSTLTAAPGSWGPAPVALTYQWSAGGSVIPGATSATLTIPASALGKTITVTVTGTKPGYTTVSKTSKATKKVTTGKLSAPAPTITGTTKVGQTLTA
ncbi:MAG: CHAP domain-containing protein, partial [Micropruina sp.]|uniref:CHAP domain-containing protein n=1 Tax=Micropruina sp. TaxID=2737536 RepID=UPI0039E3697A